MTQKKIAEQLAIEMTNATLQERIAIAERFLAKHCILKDEILKAIDKPVPIFITTEMAQAGDTGDDVARHYDQLRRQIKEAMGIGETE